MDYFSVYKPASRVVAMGAHTNNSIRTTTGLQFGVPPIATSTTNTTTNTTMNSIAVSTINSNNNNNNNNNNIKKNSYNDYITPGVSITSRRSRPSTACGIQTVHRSAITEIHSHLEKNIIEHKIEEKLIGPDFSKPPLPFALYNEDSIINHESTKHYSSYSRPYSHMNINSKNRDTGHGIFTQSVVSSIKASTSARLQKRPSTAHPTGLSSHHNASMVSNVSWGHLLPTDQMEHRDIGEGGPGLRRGPLGRSPGWLGGQPGGDAESTGSCGRFSQGDSRESEDGHCELNFAPRFDSALTSAVSSPGRPTSALHRHTPNTNHHLSKSQSQPHYLLPKSVPGKGTTTTGSTQKASIIGKQRAAPQRSKLTPNRPLASAEAFKVFY